MKTFSLFNKILSLEHNFQPSQGEGEKNCYHADYIRNPIRWLKKRKQQRGEKKRNFFERKHKYVALILSEPFACIFHFAIMVSVVLNKFYERLIRICTQSKDLYLDKSRILVLSEYIVIAFFRLINDSTVALLVRYCLARETWSVCVQNVWMDQY